jgi:uncharacterized ferritin-like protein (DUF455 family)
MELTAFAQTILTMPALAAKLTDPGILTDTAPHPATSAGALPEAPARPPELAMPRAGVKVRLPFPTRAELEDPKARGRVLHFFANHELLAMELMALAILRFPDAPTSFRLGLGATNREEQKHLGLYRERMLDLGVAVGELPVNRYFWDAMQDMPTPAAFVAQMSLTLEQANLDFSLHWRDLFASLGDERTAAILDLVYREEIGHVKHGVVWLDRWRAPDESLWNAYRRHLPAPLTPSRAKGLGFNADARRAAGLPEDFIAEVAVYTHSKGRPPVVYWLNPSCEDELANGRANYVPPAPMRELAHDLSGLMAFVAKQDDVVLVKELPTRAFQAALAAAGMPLPQLVADDDAARAALAGRLVDRFEPWGNSPVAAAREARLGLSARHPTRPAPPPALFRKTWSAALHERLSPATAASRVCADRAAVDAALADVLADGPAVIKAPLGASGRHMQRVSPAGLHGTQSAWVDKILAAQGAVVVEAWLEKILDLSVQLDVPADLAAAPQVLGVTRFLTDRRGQYVGHVLGRKLHDLTPEQRRQLAEDRCMERLTEIAADVGRALREAGHVGPAGLDALVHRQADRLRLRPVVELNPRYTMGRIALALDRRVGYGARAYWLHVPRKALGVLGYESFAALAEDAAARWPLRWHGTTLEHGALATNDPARARAVLTLLLIGEAADALAPPLLALLQRVETEATADGH